MESQHRAFYWITSQLDQGKQVQAAIIGPAGTGKSFIAGIDKEIEVTVPYSLQVSSKRCSCTSYWWNDHSQFLLSSSGLQQFP